MLPAWRYRVFSGLLHAARIKAGLTQAQVAHRLAKSQRFVSDIEHNQRRLDVIEFLAKAEVLNIDPREVIKRLQRRF